MRRKIKVLKAKGGADASLKDFNTPTGVSSGNVGPAGIKSDGSYGTAKDAKKTIQGNNQPTLGNAIKNTVQQVGTGAKQATLLPITPFGATVTAMTAVENARRAKRAKGEFFLSGKKELPITRDFYRATGRPLDTTIGSPDTSYMKDAGIIGFKKPIMGDNAGPKLCPDGTIPPCKTPLAPVASASTQNTFLSGFKAYEDGGEVVISSNVDKDLL